MFERILSWWRRRQSEAETDTTDKRIDTLTAARGYGHFSQSQGGTIPSNYLPTGVDEGWPKK